MDDKVTEAFGYVLDFAEPPILTSNLREVADRVDPGEQNVSLDRP